MFPTHFNPNNSLLIILQISLALLFMYTPALKEKKGKDLKILSVTLFGRFVEFSCHYLDSTVGESKIAARGHDLQ